MNSRLVKRTASSLFTKAKAAIGKNTFELEERRFDYKQFKIFEKTLMLESNAEYQGKTIEQKLNALSKVFADQSDINKKTLDTLIRKALDFRLQARSTGVDPLSWTPHRWSWRDTRWQTKRSGIRRSSSDRWSGW
jgi:hypothetical protein